MSEFCFNVCDENFPKRALANKQTIIIGGSNYGQGSSREHAALVPMYLGVKAVVAKSFARIHTANLINAGILPLTFVNEKDYDELNQDDDLVLTNVFASLESGDFTLLDQTTGKEYKLKGQFTPRQQGILKAGSMLAYTKEV